MNKHILSLGLILSLLLMTLSACRSAAPEPGRPQPGGAETGETAADESSPPPDREGDPAVLAVDGLNFYQDIFGDWQVCGLLRNTGVEGLYGVELQVVFLDSSGAELLTETATIAPGGIAPGGTLPFSLTASESLAALDQVEIEVQRALIADLAPVELDLVGTSLHFADNGVTLVSGQVRNPSSESVEIDRISAGLYSSAGSLVYAGDCQECVRSLAPGESGPFQILFFGYPGELAVDAEPEIQVSAESSPALPEYQLDFQAEPFTYLDQKGTFHVVGELVNSSSEILEIHLLNTLFDAAGNVLSVSSYHVLPGSLAPGESAPYDITFGGPSLGLDIQPGEVTWLIQLDRFWTREVDTPAFLLAAENASYEFTGPRASISGTVRNDSGQDLDVVLVLAGFRDKTSGDLVAFTSKIIWEPIPEGGTAAYDLALILDTQISTEALEFFLIARGR